MQELEHEVKQVKCRTLNDRDLADLWIMDAKNNCDYRLNMWKAEKESNETKFCELNEKMDVLSKKFDAILAHLSSRSCDLNELEHVAKSVANL